ncbi:hypothetical protein FKP32DRAFT_757644 [Trametes sanguinea]|nr:hypothetical protein FKP32DRAFT_757644 [Trametes sanguinea]
MFAPSCYAARRMRIYTPLHPHAIRPTRSHANPLLCSAAGLTPAHPWPSPHALTPRPPCAIRESGGAVRCDGHAFACRVRGCRGRRCGRGPVATTRGLARTDLGAPSTRPYIEPRRLSTVDGAASTSTIAWPGPAAFCDWKAGRAVAAACLYGCGRRQTWDDEGRARSRRTLAAWYLWYGIIGIRRRASWVRTRPCESQVGLPTDGLRL